jgi:hypothetical protein
LLVIATVVVTAGIAVPAAGAAGSGARPGPGYLTIMLDRAQLAQADASCGQQAGSVPLPDVLAEIAGRGMRPTASVVTAFVKETTVSCKKPALYPSWADLTSWHAQFGLELVSSGATKAKFTQIDPAHQWSESCGTLPVFEAHGFTRAWGMFNYPMDSWTIGAQSSIVANCFAWGRDYANKINTRSGQAAPWLGYVKQLVGGSCNDPALPCYNPAAPPGKRYTLPSTIATWMSPHNDAWRVIQVYRLVDGAQPGLWDCTAADPRAHWAAVVEAYCFGDLKTLLGAVSAATIVTDPAGVARAWTADALDVPSASVDAGPADGTSDMQATLSFSSPATRVTFTCSLDGGPAAHCTSPVLFSGLAAGPHSLAVVPTDAFGNRGAPAVWSWSIFG